MASSCCTRRSRPSTAARQRLNARSSTSSSEPRCAATTERRAARDQLDAGLRVAQRCGARPLAQRAYDELLASGARLRRADLENRDALTASELRIARHAAKGLTNREIAGQLYLSIKTVEMHLGRVYRKLGITARAELPEALRHA